MIVLDNFESAEELYRRLPPVTKSIVIGTCRTTGDIRTSEVGVVRVGQMARPEATEMVRLRRPMLSEQEAELVASEFSNYPIVLEFVCTLLEYSRYPVEQFCRDLKADVTRVAGSIVTDEGRTLLVALRRIATLIRRRSQPAYDLLVCLTFANARQRGKEVDDFLIAYLASAGRTEPSRLRYTQALSVLHGFSLVEVDSSSLTIHPLVKTLLTEEFAAALINVFRNISKWLKGDKDLRHACLSETQIQDNRPAILDSADDILAVCLKASKRDRRFRRIDKDLLGSAWELAFEENYWEMYLGSDTFH